MTQESRKEVKIKEARLKIKEVRTMKREVEANGMQETENSRYRLLPLDPDWYWSGEIPIYNPDPYPSGLCIYRDCHLPMQ